ncbi:MAG: hypothetical protein WC661_10080 [Opitutaceae bacterium]|jgi:hypothetical protein
MKKLLVILALALVPVLPAQTLTLSATAKGVAIDGGTTGLLVLSAPVITGSDGKSRTPVLTPAADGASATAVYADGFTIKITFSQKDGEAIYSFDHPPVGAKSLVITTPLDLYYNEGGTYAVNGGEPKLFPAEKDKQLFAQGAFTQLDIRNGSGAGFSLQMPESYQQLQDNRVWGTQSFAWIYHYDFLRYPEATGFTIKAALLKPVPAKK